MQNTTAISAHRQSYTYRFALSFKSKWEERYQQPLSIIDLADCFLTNQAAFKLEPNKKTLNWMGEDLDVIYAFHPQALKRNEPDLFQSQAMACAYAVALAAGQCANSPMMGTWGLHLTFLHARRLFLASGMNVAQITTENMDTPSIRPFQTFLLPNICSAQKAGSLFFADLTGNWQERLVTTHVVNQRVHSTGADGQTLEPYFSKENYVRLSQLTGSQVLEVIELELSNGSRVGLGIHPCIMNPTAALLNELGPRRMS